MLKAIAIEATVVVGGVLVLAALRPDNFQIRRSASIKAAPERSYSGPESGKGAAYAFDGNQDMGKGTLEILDSAPASKVTMSLHMLEPFEVRNRVDFVLQPKDGMTEVTWAMQGTVPYFAKIIHLFINMDR